MLTPILISVFFIIFPLFISLKIVYNGDSKGVNLSLFLFNFIKIFKSKIYIRKNKLTLKINNKEKIIKLNKKLLFENNLNKIIESNILKFTSNVEIGSDNIESIFNLMNLLNLINNILGNNYKKIKPQLKIDNNLRINLDENIFKINIKIIFLLNILSIIFNLIRKIIYVKK